MASTLAGSRTPSTAPKPALAHIPALDGLRAVAVAAVLAFHGGLGWAHGGYLGVDLFFVLSGYLIARKLLTELDGSGTIAIGRFWAGRFRRLLPAQLVLLLGVTVYAVLVAEANTRESIRHDTWAALGYVSNWRFIVDDVGYFASDAAPSPVRHLWSLSVEEQFYLVFPLLLVVLARRGWRGTRLAAVVVALIAASTLWTAHLAAGGAEVTRLYEGTDTRLATILIGVLGALVADVAGRAPRLLGGLSAAGVVVLVGIGAVARGDDLWMYPGGQLAFAVAAAVVVVSLGGPGGGPGRGVLATAPMVGLGRISYGLYLWHWPTFLVLTPDRTGLDGPLLFVVRVVASIALAIASYVLVEQPIRTRRVRPRNPGLLAMATIGAVALLAGVATAGAPSDQLLAPRRSTGAPPSLTVTAPTGELDPLVGSQAPPPAQPGRPLRLALVGDSAASSLDFYGPTLTGATLATGTTIGCGIMAPAVPNGRDEVSETCAEWKQRWSQALTGELDLVLVVVGAWEIGVHRYQGRTLEARGPDDTDPATTAFVDGQLDQAVALIHEATPARIAVLELACAPFLDRGLGEDPPPRTRPEVTEWFNQRLAALAERNDGLVQIVSLNDRLCPDGKAVEEFEGTVLRSDGTHWTEQSAPLAWGWLLPQLADAAYRPN